MSLRTLVTAVALLGSLAALAWGWQHLPERHRPWAPLAFDDAPNWLTRYKLQRLNGPACMAFLASTPLAFTPLRDEQAPAGCAFDDAVRVRNTALAIGAPVTLSCRAAASLVLWEHHVVQPAALRSFGRPVQRLLHAGSLACRNVYGRADGRRSQHASADAIDITGFVLGPGRSVGVARHWRGNSAESGFLREVQAGACVYFDGVLGPDYNAAHADHFHLDRGPYRICR